MSAVQWGNSSDTPVLGDFDNDCKLDLAVRRTVNAPATGDTQFYIRYSNGGTASVQWGREEMSTAIADYDGDGKSDIGVVANISGQLRWYVYSPTGTTLFYGTPFGVASDVVTVGNYDGDAKADFSVWRPTNGTFYYRLTTNGADAGRTFGSSSDTPTARAAQYPLP